jgi:hypothetical protein
MNDSGMASKDSNDDSISLIGLFGHVRCNCWPFVQTSLSAKSSAMTGSTQGASTCSARGKYKRYILATLYYIYYMLYAWYILIHIVIN